MFSFNTVLDELKLILGKTYNYNYQCFNLIWSFPTAFQTSLCNTNLKKSLLSRQELKSYCPTICLSS